MKSQFLLSRNLGPIQETNNKGLVHRVLVEKGAGHNRQSVGALAWRTGQRRVLGRTFEGWQRF